MTATGATDTQHTCTVAVHGRSSATGVLLERETTHADVVTGASPSSGGCLKESAPPLLPVAGRPRGKFVRRPMEPEP